MIWFGPSPLTLLYDKDEALLLREQQTEVLAQLAGSLVAGMVQPKSCPCDTHRRTWQSYPSK